MENKEKIIALLRQDLDLKRQIQELQSKQRAIKKEVLTLLTQQSN